MSLDPSDPKHLRYMEFLEHKIKSNSFINSKNARLASALVYKGDIVSTGFNEKRTHPFQQKFSSTIHNIYLHAETNAIRLGVRFLSDRELEKSILYICRLSYEDTNKKKMFWNLAHPCNGCIRCISSFGIRKVVYTTGNNLHPLEVL